MSNKPPIILLLGPNNFAVSPSAAPTPSQTKAKYSNFASTTTFRIYFHFRNPHPTRSRCCSVWSSDFPPSHPPQKMKKGTRRSVSIN